MPMSYRSIKADRFTPVTSLGLGLLILTGCSPPEAGSVKLPENFKPSGPMSYGPAGLKGTAPSLGPGDFRPAMPPRAKSNQSGRRPTGSTKR